jgi:hypothetical protein
VDQDYRHSKASCKNISSLAVWEASLARSLAMVMPAVEKTCSDGAYVAGMHSNLVAKIESSLYFLSLNFYQVKGQLNDPSSFLSRMDGSCLYKANSASAAVAIVTPGSPAATLAALFSFSSK